MGAFPPALQRSIKYCMYAVTPISEISDSPENTNHDGCAGPSNHEKSTDLPYLQKQNEMPTKCCLTDFLNQSTKTCNHGNMHLSCNFRGGVSIILKLGLAYMDATNATENEKKSEKSLSKCIRSLAWFPVWRPRSNPRNACVLPKITFVYHRK